MCVRMLRKSLKMYVFENVCLNNRKRVLYIISYQVFCYLYMFISDFNMSDQNHETVLNERLSEVGLNAAKWARVLQEHLGIQTVHGLQYIGKEAYQLLVHFVTEPQEKIALRFFLKLHKTNVAYRVEQKTMLEMRCNALKETLINLEIAKLCESIDRMMRCRP